MDIQKQVESFTLLHYEQKRAKVLAMLEPIRGKSKMFADIYDKVTTIADLPENILISIYQGILEVAQAISQGNKAEEMIKIKKISNIIESLHQKENIEKEREGNPDDLLENV